MALAKAEPDALAAVRPQRAVTTGGLTIGGHAPLEPKENPLVTIASRGLHNALAALSSGATPVELNAALAAAAGAGCPKSCLTLISAGASTSPTSNYELWALARALSTGAADTARALALAEVSAASGHSADDAIATVQSDSIGVRTALLKCARILPLDMRHVLIAAAAAGGLAPLLPTLASAELAGSDALQAAVDLGGTTQEAPPPSPKLTRCWHANMAHRFGPHRYYIETGPWTQHPGAGTPLWWALLHGQRAAVAWLTAPTLEALGEHASEAAPAFAEAAATGGLAVELEFWAARGDGATGRVLRCAAAAGHEDVVQWLLIRGAPATETATCVGCEEPLSALVLAAEADASDCCAALLDASAPVPAIAASALHAAARTGSSSAAETILSYLFSHNQPCPATADLLAAAAVGDCQPVLNALLEPIPRVNLSAKALFGNTPLAAAAAAGSAAGVQALLAAGAVIEPGVLALAAASGSDRVVEALLDAGAVPDDAAVRAALHSGVYTIAEAVLAVTPAALSDDVGVWVAAAAAGAPGLALAQKWSGQRPSAIPGLIRAAAAHGSASAVSVLAEETFADADVSGITALHIAAARGYAGCVNTLIAFGALPGICDNVGNSAAHWAAAGRHFSMAEGLVVFGASLYRPNGMGQTPYTLMHGHDSPAGVVDAAELASPIPVGIAERASL